MKHQYQIAGMTCGGCVSKVSDSLNAIEGVTQANVSLPGSAEITMEQHVATKTMQAALDEAGDYNITMVHHHSDAASKEAAAATENAKNHACCSKDHADHQHHSNHNHPLPELADDSAGKYHCPMHCEGPKVYIDAGPCPVCGMDLEKLPELVTSRSFTCPMHSEIVKAASTSR